MSDLYFQQRHRASTGLGRDNEPGMKHGENVPKWLKILTPPPLGTINMARGIANGDLMSNKMKWLLLAGVLLAGGATAYARLCVSGVRMYKITNSDGSVEYIICTGEGGNCTTGNWRQWAANGCGM